MKLLVNELSVSPHNFPRLGSRSYMELDVQMSKEFLYDNVVNMLGHMTDQEVAHMLETEFKMELK